MASNDAVHDAVRSPPWMNPGACAHIWSVIRNIQEQKAGGSRITKNR